MRPPRWCLVAGLVAGLLSAGAAHAQLVYWLDTNHASPTLNRCNPDGSARVTLALPAGTLPEGLDFDAWNRRLYWSEASWSGARVQRCALDFSALTTVSSGWSCLRGVAFDAVGGRIYATSSNLTGTGSAVRRWNSDGASPTLLASLGSNANPRGVALDLAGGRLLWTDFDQGLIASAPLAGSPVTTFLALVPGARPYGVAIDADAGQLYWTDYALGTISRVPLAGGDVTPLVSGLANPTYLALDPAGDRMFWIEAGAGAQKLKRATLAGTAVTPLNVPMSSYGGVVFVPATGYVDAPARVPSELSFALLSENPARGPLRVECALPRAAFVRVSVLDVQGREVARLAEGPLEAGRHAFAWEIHGRAPGIYFARMFADGREFTRRVTLIN